MSGSIWDSYSGLHQESNINAFVGVFFNDPLLENVDHVPHVFFLTANMTLLLGNIPPAFQHFYSSAYNYEQMKDYRSTRPYNH